MYFPFEIFKALLRARATPWFVWSINRILLSLNDRIISEE